MRASKVKHEEQEASSNRKDVTRKMRTTEGVMRTGARSWTSNMEACKPQATRARKTVRGMAKYPDTSPQWTRSKALAGV